MCASFISKRVICSFVIIINSEYDNIILVFLHFMSLGSITVMMDLYMNFPYWFSTDIQDIS